MPFYFDHPWLLALFALLPVAVWVSRRSMADLSRQRRAIALGLRLVLLGSLVLAMAGLHWVQSNGAVCTLFLIDTSQSLPRTQRTQALDVVKQAMAGMRTQDRAGVITFGGDARLAVPPMERGGFDVDMSLPAPGGGDQTNVARAISTALATFPTGMAKRIVLLTDGNETVGSALEAARSAQADEVPIDVVPLGRDLKAETSLERMLTPPTAKKGEPFPVKIVASSLTGGTGTLRLLRNGKSVGEQRVTLKPGKNAIGMTQKAESPGFYTYETQLVMDNPASDTITENNRALSFVKVQGKPRVLALAQNGAGDVTSASLSRALGAQEVDVDVRRPSEMPSQIAALLGYDAVVVSDVPAEALNDRQQRTLAAAVKDVGMGLVMVGGERGFGAGGYFGTPLAEAMPVDLDIRKMRRFPGVALAMAIDKSGSMGACHCGKQGVGARVAQGVNKTDISREAAVRAVETLSMADQVGVIAVDSLANVVVPMQFASNRGAIVDGIGTIREGGSTNLPGGLEAAYDMLQGATAKIKHAILVTDGWSNTHDYEPVIEKMRAAKITLTVVAIDEGENIQFLRTLEKMAKETGGRYYLVQDVGAIPKIYTREVQTISKPPIIEEAFVPRVADAGHPLLSGVAWDSAPPLLGYDVTSPKPTAEVPLVSHKGDPILATWQYGLGKSVAFTSDAQPRWAAQWVGGWGSFGPFWAQAVRSVLKKNETGSYQSRMETDDRGRARITIDAIDKDGAFVNFLDAKAKVIGPDGATQVVRLQQTGAGRYVGAFDANKTGSYVASIVQKGADGKEKVSTAGMAIPYAAEFASWKTNEPLLLRVAEVTGGKARTDGNGVFAERRVARTPVPMAAALLLLALCLLPFDVATRRLMLDAKQAKEIVDESRVSLENRLAARRPKTLRTAPATASVGRLLDRKSRLQSDEDGIVAPPSASPASSVTWGSGTPKPSAPPPSGSPKAADEPAGGYRSRLLDAKRRAAKTDDG